MNQFSDDELQPLVDRLTLDEKVLLLTGKDSWSLHAVAKIGLDALVLSDGPVGVRGDRWDERSPSVNFPSPTALASSWDRDAIRLVGEGLGSEARDKGAHVVLAPTINLHRTPYGGRHFEAFSEDPFLTGRLASAYVEGIQAQGVGATVKHYVANDSETDRFTVDVRVHERTLREVYLLAFEEPVVEAGSWLVMSAYNSINGTTASENHLLVTPLNDEWGFDGVVVSDWTAVRSIESARHPQDLAMPGPHGAWGPALVEAVLAGTVDEPSIDRKVRRILRLAARVGALRGFDRDAPGAQLSPDRRRAVARRAAVDGMVLLENRGVLPLDSPRSIALIGEGAKVARTQGGGSATVISEKVVTPLDGISERWPDAEVTWSLGAVVQSGLADLEASTFETVDGEPGMIVRYFDTEGGLLAQQRREASGIVSFDGVALASRSALVEMQLRYRPTSPASVVPFAIAGLCDFEVLADGVVAASGELRTAPNDDPATAVLNPPYTAIELPVEGDSVEVVARFRPVLGGIPGALAFRVGLPPLDADGDALIAEAVDAAQRADVAVVVVSTSAEVESEGFDRTSLALPGRQDDLVREVAAVNPRTIVIVNSGAPVLLPWRAAVGAAVVAWFPGQEFGAALADVLSGDREPGGRLPVTWPTTEADLPVWTVAPVEGRLVYAEGVHIGHRAWLKSRTEPAYPFGYGLGYTTWELSGLSASDIIAEGAGIDVEVTAMNVGAVEGKTVVQLYLERVSPSSVDRPLCWLAGFAAATAAPGESVTLTIRVDWRRFAHWDGTWALEAGEFRLCAGLSSADLPLDVRIAAADDPAVRSTESSSGVAVTR